MAFCLAGILLMWMYIAFFPLIQQQSESIKGLLQSMPKGLLRAFGVENLNIFNLEGFLTYKHYTLMLPLMIIFLMASLAGTGLSGEVERGTIEISLACPVSRLRMFFGLYFAGLVMLIVFTICAVLVIAPLAGIYGMAYIFRYHFLVAVMSLFFGWAVFSLSMLISAVNSELRRAYMILGGIIFAMYILDLLGALVNSLAWMKYFSFFYYFNPNQIMMHQALPLTSILVFTASALILTLAGALWFKARDVGV